jgi:hypothetical protein
MCWGPVQQPLNVTRHCDGHPGESGLSGFLRLGMGVPQVGTYRCRQRFSGAPDHLL